MRDDSGSPHYRRDEIADFLKFLLMLLSFFMGGGGVGVEAPLTCSLLYLYFAKF